MKNALPLPPAARIEYRTRSAVPRKIGRTGPLALAGPALLLTLAPASAEFEITAGTGMKMENFDSLSSGAGDIPWMNDATLAPGDSTLEGWSLFDSVLNGIPTYRSSSGTSGTGYYYSFGAGADADRGLGSVASGGAYFGSPGSGSAAGYMAFAARNNSASVLTSFMLGFDGEQWRNANTGPQTLVFEYGFGADFASVPAWQAPGAGFNFTSPVVGGPTASVDGNTAGLTAGLGGSVNGLNWTSGETLWLRWVDFNDAGNDHGLGIDNFAFSWMAGVPPKNVIWNPGPTAVWDTSTVNWLEGGSPATFAPFDNVSFTDAGLAGGSTVTVEAGGVSPGNVSVSNATGVYTLAGGAISGSGQLTKTGAGALVLSTSYSRSIVVSEGSLATTAGDLLSDTGSITLGEGASLDLRGNSDTVGALSLTGATITTGAGTLTVNGGITVGVGNATASITGNLSQGSSPRTYSVAENLPAVDFLIDGPIAGSGRITFDGFGAVRLNGDNSGQTGGFQIQSGVGVVLGNKNALGPEFLFLNGGRIETAGNFTGAEAVTTPVSLGGDPIFTGMDLELAGAFRFFDPNLGQPASRTITNESNLIISGALTDMPTVPGSFSKDGAGTLTFSGDNPAFTRRFAINRGLVVLASANPLGVGGITINSGFFGETTTLDAAVSTTIGPLSSFADDVRVRLGSGPAGPGPLTLTLTTNAAESGFFAGAIENAPGHVGGVTIAGDGVQFLAGANTYTGPTQVDSGALIVSGSLAGTSGVNVAAGGTLGGDGTITLDPAGSVLVNPNAIFAPRGDFVEIGVLDVIGQPFTLPSRTFRADGAFFQMQLGSPNPGGTANPANAGMDDGLNLTGTIGLDGAALQGSLLFGFNNAIDDLFFLIFNDGVDPITGAFAGLPQGSTLNFSGPEGSVTFAVSYMGDSASNAFTAVNGNDFVLRALTVIPEPGSAGMLVLGALGLVASRGRRRLK